MFKNEDITEFHKNHNYKRENIIVEQEKENKSQNIKEENSNEIKIIYSKKGEDNNYLYNSKINERNSLKNIDKKNNFKIINIDYLGNNNKNSEKNKMDMNFNDILNTQNNNKNDSNINLKDIKESDEIHNKNNYNLNHNSKEKKIRKVNSQRNFLYKKEIEKVINLEQKNERNNKNGLISFNSFFVKKKNNNKNFSLEKDCVDKKENNNLILLKYSKEHKPINNKEKAGNIKEQIKVKKIENNSILKKEKDNIKNDKKTKSKIEKDDDKNIEIGNIKDIQNEEEKIPYNQTIFQKILEEVKGEKNYIQKVVHRQIIHQRDFLRNSYSFNKYDTNTYKEIVIKRIKNPFSISINKENINNISINRENENRINDSRENNNLNYSNVNLFNDNLKFSEFNNNRENNNKNKSTIKIKKIPLNKLKNRIKIPHMNYNFIPRANNTQRIFTSQNSHNNYSSFNHENTNQYAIPFPRNLSKSKNININKIRRNNNSVCYQNNNNISFNKEFLENNTNKEFQTKKLYNKVKLKKKFSENINTPRIKINKVNSLFNSGNNNININNNNNDLIKSNNNFRKIIKMNSGKINYDRNNNGNILSVKHLSNTNTLNNETDINEYQNKMIQEKKIGLFKNNICEISVEKPKNIPCQKLLSNKLYTKKLSKLNKLNNPTYKSYLSTQNKSLNDSSQLNSFIKLNNNDSLSFISFETNTIESINKFNSKFSTKKEIPNNIISYDNLNTNEIKFEQIISLLSFEDLLIIEDKLYIVLQIFKNGKKSPDEIFDLWNFFFSSSLKPKFEQIYKYFLKETESMKIFINYSLILIIICYDFCFNTNKNNNIYFSLFEALRLIYINLLIIIFSIKNKIIAESKDNYNLRLIEMSNINKIIKKNLINFNNNANNEGDSLFNREILNNNTNLLIQNLTLIIYNYNQKNILNLFYGIKSSSLEDINIFFRKNILHEDFLGCSVLASTYLKAKQNFKPLKIPYIISNNKKKYSLILDLDETLIHFKINHNKNDEGVLKLRPGVFTFLEKVKEFYEIILFTEASEAYTELIMEAFNKKKYFDYKLYRQHTIIIGQDFVKDLQRIGRSLDRIIIIDNITQNFRMQKGNGINIKPFYGEDQNDKALIDLIPILTNIAKDNIDTRNGLIKYRDEIITKITTNLFFRNNDKFN